MEIDFQYLGRVEYEEGLRLQNELVDKRYAGEIPDTVLFLEHEPVYTIGRTRDRSSLGNLASLPHPVVEINRGGQATYHGPGQMVGYLILDLHAYGKDLHTYLRCIESFLIDFCQTHGVETERRDGLTGVWIENRKLASIGVGVRKWITMHGFGLNLAKDLSGYESITPCGISGVEMSSLEKEANTEITVAESTLKMEQLIRNALADLHQETVVK